MSPSPRIPSLLDHFSALKDPREPWRVIYPLPEIMLLVLCATLTGMEDFVEIKLWGEQRIGFLRRFLSYDRGIPSHDTLNDVMNALDPGLFKACFTAWVEGLRGHCQTNLSRACQGCRSEALRPPADATRPGRRSGSV